MNSRVGSVHADLKDRYDIHEIDPCLLSDPSRARNQQEYYLGRGSFGIVALKMYRGIHVAVKQMHIKSALRDVQHEAEMTACLCHPFLPCLFGICTTTKPFKIVTQFHGFMGDHPLSITVRRELDQHKIGLKDIDWISVCAQVLEAVNYLHKLKSAEILHNDITGTNILLGNLQQCTSAMNTIAGGYQILLIDLGKGTKATQGKMYHLSHRQKIEYLQKFPHIPPEVIEGEYQQSTFSDMYAVGGLFYQIAESGCISVPLYRKTLLKIYTREMLAGTIVASTFH